MPRTKNATAPLKFAKDQFGKEVLLKDNELPVMMEWEKPYVEACIDAIRPKDAEVLEVGFALGYGASQIQKHQPKSHTIIESDPTVIAKAKEWAKKQKNKVNIIEGKWQEALSKLGKFDAIFLNEYIPYEQEEIQEMMSNSEACQEAASETHALAEALNENLKKWDGIKFSDAELQKFGKQVMSRPGITMRDVLDFTEYLEDMGHINKKQKDAFVKGFQQEAKDLNMPKGIWSRQHAALSKAFLGNHLLAFAETCLDWHMKPGARLSAYLGSADSKKKDEEFKERILSRKINYTEKTIPVSVPANCQYFHGDKALVIVIEKK